jgi:Protein of unknown function (DUF3037)
MRVPYEYAVIQAVPRAERGELINVGVVLYCQRRDFLAARTELRPDRLRALDPGADVDAIRAALAAWEAACADGPLTLGERFRWLTAPRSTVLRAGPVHTGLAADPGAETDRLLDLLVR